LKNFISILHSSVFPQSSSLQVRRSVTKSIPIHQYKMSFTTRNNRNISTAAKAPFCKVCFDAHLPASEYTSHFVKDQPGPNGKVVCPTLLSQKCLICGVAGHTSSYCPDNSSVSSSSTVQNQSRYKLSTDEIRQPVHSIRLPPIQHRTAPRIVYATDIQAKTTTNTNTISKSNKTENESAFPALPNLSSLRRFENDEPKLRRETPAEASPVHSPSPKKSKKVKYNRTNNPFGVLYNDNVDDGDDDDSSSDVDVDNVQTEHLPVIPSSSLSSSSSWASIAAAAAGRKSTVVVAPSKQPQQQESQAQQRTRSRFSIVVPTAISTALPLIPPPSFKPKPADLEKEKKVKKCWGDTDSEDDEEFLSRGLN
jgi:hypothetical protein